MEGGASSDTTVHVCHAQVVQTQRHCQSTEERSAEYHTAVQYRSERVLCENAKVKHLQEKRLFVTEHW